MISSRCGTYTSSQCSMRSNKCKVHQLLCYFRTAMRKQKHMDCCTSLKLSFITTHGRLSGRGGCGAMCMSHNHPSQHAGHLEVRIIGLIFPRPLHGPPSSWLFE